ncbi:DUF4826 family protein [Pseudidiomarina terrestris]|uniref:DUF4826 family protein n=1 Tax=Pseudidiomarina terrestris TaxID=2820060 RepID=A0AAW7QZC9_9GAMM|nr:MULTISPECIES: DUF4826 family protein [unclassified Pseudidiomarina]MDN7123664.1 DUF4826 family protein [Pseudidiomarina sp. 1APP75-32.1]MDN7126546.1 DUF4826 family protein [Pseudidiomarina sp. 1APR75-33.1]MDN7128612.1 DUF4826 family protein [Pseudidiomarina sp. 1APR75-15]MDN7135129.1 DUF4826 family protein [Pseudidiomarina sp. 1ASP75-5]MDN7137800.1 DUF4826 family protein [Pseudidiomarina sp. 1ASP75-14]
MATEQPQMTQEEMSAWVREHFQAANKYLAENGIISDRVLTKDSRYLAPYVAIWKFSTQDKKELWLVNGDVPTDVAGNKAADNARDALRYFSFQWQMKAQGILGDPKSSADPEQQRYAQYLIDRAEALYDVVGTEELWQAPAEQGNS